MPGHAPTDRSRRLGQHFLGNRRLAARLVADAGIHRGERVVDFGAGTGILTDALAAEAASVLAVELDRSLADRLARRFAGTPNVVVLHADVAVVPLPRTPYRVVANPPFARTAAILRRVLDPAGGLQRADLVVQWQVARRRAEVDAGPPLDLLGATWAPWWEFRRGRRLPAACFDPRPAVDAAVLVVTRRDPPLLPASEFDRWRTWLTNEFERRADAPQVEMAKWLSTYRRTRP